MRKHGFSPNLMHRSAGMAFTDRCSSVQKYCNLSNVDIMVRMQQVFEHSSLSRSCTMMFSHAVV